MYAKDAQTLTCPCKQISINHRKFLTLTYTFHQVCYSQFVSQHWLYYLNGSLASLALTSLDFRVTGVYHFQALISLCELLSTTISDSLTRFYDTQYVSMFVRPQKVLGSQGASLVNAYKTSTTNNFLTSMQIVRDTTQANALLSSIFTNVHMYLNGYLNGQAIIVTERRRYLNCSCASSYACIYESAIYNGLSNVKLFCRTRFIYWMLCGGVIVTIDT